MFGKGISYGLALGLIILAVSPASGQVKTRKPVFVEPGPRIETRLYSDGSVKQFETETVWKPFCIDDATRITVDDLRRVAEITKAAAAANPAPPEPEGHAAGVIPPRFTLNFVPTTSMPAGALEALAQVKYYYESQFTDPITININIAFAAMGPGILGGTSSNYVNVNWPVARDALINGMDGNDTIQNFLPPGSTIPVRYDGNSATVTNENRVFATYANHRAAIGTVAGTAASMTFNNQFSWDYTPPSISGGSYCFQSVIVHEVGHALGFVSGADFRTNDIEMLDIFRFQRSDGAGDYNPDDNNEFSTTARMVDQNAPGTNDDVNSDLIVVEYQMSDGNPNQASHFRDQTPVIGIMDPTFGSGQTFYPNFLRTPDQNMFDAIGYDFPHLNQSCPQDSEFACNTSIHFDNLPLNNAPSPSFSCGNGSSHVGALWWSFTATHSSARISTCDSQATDTTFAVYGGDCDNLVQLACGETGGCPNANHASLCVQGLTVGQTYYIQVASRNLTSRGIIEIDLQCSCDGACCMDPPALCLVTNETVCNNLGGFFAGGESACSGDDDADGADDTCQSSFTTFGQVPTQNQEQLPSNMDVSDLAPNNVIVDGFTSDGRAIRGVRWWGSVLDPSVNSDGWFVGFHEPRSEGGSDLPALGLYYCAREVVTTTANNFDACLPEEVVQYEVALLDCCLVNVNPDSRTNHVPATAGGFLSENCAAYGLSIQAVAGRRYNPDGLGGCNSVATATTAVGDFWSWHSTQEDHETGQALATTMSESGSDWLFGAWANVAASCGNPNTAFELLSSKPAGLTAAVIWNNGLPNNVDALNAQYGGARLDWLTVDDVEFADGAIVNDLHWFNEEQNTFVWDNKVRLEIYPDNVGAPDASGGPFQALWVPIDAGQVSRTPVSGGFFSPRYRYDVTDLNIALPPGRWWIGVASAGAAGSTGFSFWPTSHRQGVSLVFFGSEAYTKAPSNGIPNFVTWSSRNGGFFYDVNFQVTTSVLIDCNCNGVPDDQDVQLADCNGNGIPDDCEDDCNANGSPDDCDINALISLDCQENGRPDECDIAYGYSVDATGDGIPDECCQVMATPVRDPGDVDKCRFITVPPAEPGIRAIRVRLASLHHPSPPYAGGPAADFSAFEGQVRWLGPPVQYVEASSTPIPFWVSTLQCVPFYTDWSLYGTVHVNGREIVPSSSYDVQWITVGCTEGSESSYSSPLTIATTRWADVEVPFNPPSLSTQPDLSDVSALVNKFRNLPGAPIKARTLITGEIPDPNGDFSFIHISSCVDAFRGAPYPLTGPVSCP